MNVTNDDRTEEELLDDPAVRAGLARLGQQPPRKTRCPRCWRGMVNPGSRHGFCQPCEGEYDERVKASRRRSYRRRKQAQRDPTSGETDCDGLQQRGEEIEIAAADGSPFLRIDEAAEVLRINRATLYRWIKSGVIRSIKLGGVAYVTTDEIHRVLEQAERQHDQEDSDHA